MPQIKANFVLNSKMPNFSRDSFKRLEDMRIVNTDHIDDGHISYCEETKKHYIFRSDLSHNTETGYWRELTFEDSVVFDSKEDMLNTPDADIKRIPAGKIALCKEDGKLYFNAYYLGENNKSNETGYWKILVDIEDNTYVTDEELPGIINNAIGEYDFGTTGLVTYESVDKMKQVDPEVSKVAYGQLAFCEENEMHYYRGKSSNDKYGYFKLLSVNKILKPTITNPSSTMELVSYNLGAYNDDNNAYVVQAGTTAPTTGNFKLNINKGKVDYSGFPDGRPSHDYVTGIISAEDPDEGIKTILECSRNGMVTDIPNVIETGSYEYRYNVYYNPAEDPLDSNFDVCDELKWDRNRSIKSTDSIVINGSKAWYASSKNQTDLVLQGVPFWKDNIVVTTTLVPTAQREQEIKIPRVAKSIGVYNNISGKYDLEDLNNDWEMTQEGEYYIYRYKKEKGGEKGSRKIQVTY